MPKVSARRARIDGEGEVVSIVCDYCGSDAPLVTGREIYPHRPDLYGKRFYKCTPCDAYVGCHDGTENAFGRLANAELRDAKMEAHAFLDKLWKSGDHKRGHVYGWLANQLGIDKKDCHIGMFDVAMCRRVVEVCLTSKPEKRT